MSKYDRLGTYLRERGLDEMPVSFADIERIVGVKLPKSQDYQAWWSNSTSNNVMTNVWLNAGYRTERVDTAAKTLVFKRVGQAAKGYGMSDVAREFKPAEIAGTKQNRHPALGAMKGTFAIEPGYDLTSPMYSDEEWAEIEKEMSQDWDRIEQGMSGGNK